MTKATEYDRNWLQYTRPQPMYDKKIHKLFNKIFYDNPAENHGLANEFKEVFINSINNLQLNYYHGFSSFNHYDIIIGCTQFIDDLYIRLSNNLMVMSDDYKYHERLFPNKKMYNLGEFEVGKELLISLPFPYYGDVHPMMNEIIQECEYKNIPIHIDGAWIGCSKQITFDFSNPIIKSLGISLSKGLGLGGNRIGLRLSKLRYNDSISIMNDFNMICQSLVHVGLYFLKELPFEYYWLNYEKEYNKICNDFDLLPTKSIHLAMENNRPVGIRPLLRYLKDG